MLAVSCLELLLFICLLGFYWLQWSFTDVPPPCHIVCVGGSLDSWTFWLHQCTCSSLCIWNLPDWLWPSYHCFYIRSERQIRVNSDAKTFELRHCLYLLSRNCDVWIWCWGRSFCERNTYCFGNIKLKPERWSCWGMQFWMTLSSVSFVQYVTGEGVRYHLTKSRGLHVSEDVQVIVHIDQLYKIKYQNSCHNVVISILI